MSLGVLGEDDQYWHPGLANDAVFRWDRPVENTPNGRGQGVFLEIFGRRSPEGGRKRCVRGVCYGRGEEGIDGMVINCGAVGRRKGSKG